MRSGFVGVGDSFGGEYGIFCGNGAGGGTRTGLGLSGVGTDGLIGVTGLVGVTGFTGAVGSMLGAIGLMRLHRSYQDWREGRNGDRELRRFDPECAEKEW
jgi:hypothetical protein